MADDSSQIQMSHFTTTSMDAFRDPRTYKSTEPYRPNEGARARRRNQQQADFEDTSHHIPSSDKAGVHGSTSKNRTLSLPQSQLDQTHAYGSSETEKQKRAKYDVDKSAVPEIETTTLRGLLNGELLKLHTEQELSRHERKGSNRTNEDMLELEDQIRATIYGHCIGDAIGLLTEFMSKCKADRYYGEYQDQLEYEHKIEDGHRRRWAIGDWTDDSDQMILIMQSLTDNKGKISETDFASRLKHWTNYGFEELGDRGGLGIGRTTYQTANRHCFKTKPYKAAEQTWKESGETLAPNGGVMRTSILGVHQFWNLTKVTANARDICRTTHADPRCQASAVAVCIAIALMLQREPPYFDWGKEEYVIDKIIQKCYQCAEPLLTDPHQKTELHHALKCTDLAVLQLDDRESIGYTFKCLGAGFWALKQNDFRTALTQIVMSGGDADTNGAVAGALLGCKLRKTFRLPESWYNGLKHRLWLNEQISRYLKELRRMYKGEMLPPTRDSSEQDRQK